MANREKLSKFDIWRSHGDFLLFVQGVDGTSIELSAEIEQIEAVIASLGEQLRLLGEDGPEVTGPLGAGERH